MRRVLFLAVALGLLFPRPAAAITFTVTGTVVTASYTEPTTNADATPLLDLAHTNVYFQLPGQPPVRGPNSPAAGVPTATPPRPPAQGGGAITTTVTVPVGPNQEADVTFWATATDTSGNESARSAEFVRRIDRLPPGAPQ